MVVARIVRFPRPSADELIPDGLPPAADPHHCPAFTVPVTVYTDRAGRAWIEHECQVCGDFYEIPADLAALARLSVIEGVTR